MSILEQMIDKSRADGQVRLPGEDVFKLHDTYGFPLDLTREIAAEQGLELDEEGFHAEMNRQKDMARKALREKAGSPGARAVCQKAWIAQWRPCSPATTPWQMRV